LSAGLCPDPLGELTSPPRLPAVLSGKGPQSLGGEYMGGYSGEGKRRGTEEWQESGRKRKTREREGRIGGKGGGMRQHMLRNSKSACPPQ